MGGRLGGRAHARTERKYWMDTMRMDTHTSTRAPDSRTAERARDGAGGAAIVGFCRCCLAGKLSSTTSTSPQRRRRGNRWARRRRRNFEGLSGMWAEATCGRESGEGWRSGPQRPAPSARCATGGGVWAAAGGVGAAQVLGAENVGGRWGSAGILGRGGVVSCGARTAWGGDGF